MRLDGALKPHHGAPAIGSSIGVGKCRNKRCVAGGAPFVMRYSNSSSSSNISIGNSDNSDNSSEGNNRRRAPNQNRKQNDNQIRYQNQGNQQQQQQQQQQRNITIRQLKQEKEGEQQAVNHLSGLTSGRHNRIATTIDPNNNCSFDNFDESTNGSSNNNQQDQNQNGDVQKTKNDLGMGTLSLRTDNTGTTTHRPSLTAADTTLSTTAGIVEQPLIAAATAMRAVVDAFQAFEKFAYARVVRFFHYLILVAFVLGLRPRISAAIASTFKMRAPPTTRSMLWLLLAIGTLQMPHPVHCDENDFFAVNSFTMGLETPTPEFDYASRGQKKFGDKCENTLECGFPGSICDPKKKSCQCTEDLPVTNHIDKCGKEAAVNESCFFNEQCEVKYFQTECRDGRCVCRFDMTPVWGKDGSVECKGRNDKRGPETYIDPAMIGVLVGMALMFIIICVVLRLFSQARWRENRTIFNTPNPRLMNVSLLRDSKLLHGQERRGSRMSVRAPSRQPSMASLRPHSPNPSLGKTGSRSGSVSVSNASATSVRSTRSNSVAPGHVVANSNNTNHHHERKGSQYHPHSHTHHHHQQQQQQQQQSEPQSTNITENPVAENVTVEIIVPEK